MWLCDEIHAVRNWFNGETKQWTGERARGSEWATFISHLLSVISVLTKLIRRKATVVPCVYSFRRPLRLFIRHLLIVIRRNFHFYLFIHSLHMHCRLPNGNSLDTSACLWECDLLMSLENDPICLLNIFYLIDEAMSLNLSRRAHSIC